MPQSTEHVAVFEFVREESPFEVGFIDIKDSAAWPILTRQLCESAGAGRRDPARVVLRLRAPEKGPSHRGYVIKGDELMVYVKRCINEGTFGQGFSARGVLEVVNTQSDSGEEDDPPAENNDAPPSKQHVMSEDKKESAYLRIRPQALFWTEAMVKAVKAFPAATRKGKNKWKQADDDLVGLFIIDSHKTHMLDICKEVCCPARVFT